MSDFEIKMRNVFLPVAGILIVFLIVNALLCLLVIEIVKPLKITHDIFFYPSLVTTLVFAVTWVRPRYMMINIVRYNMSRGEKTIPFFPFIPFCFASAGLTGILQKTMDIPPVGNTQYHGDIQLLMGGIG